MIIRNAHFHAWSLQTKVKSIHNTSTLWIKNSMWQMLHFAILVNNLIRIELNSHRKRHEKRWFWWNISWDLFMEHAAAVAIDAIVSAHSNLFRCPDVSMLVFIFFFHFWLHNLNSGFLVARFRARVLLICFHHNPWHIVSYWKEPICKAARSSYTSVLLNFFWIFCLCLFFIARAHIEHAKHFEHNVLDVCSLVYCFSSYLCAAR